MRPRILRLWLGSFARMWIARSTPLLTGALAGMLIPLLALLALRITPSMRLLAIILMLHLLVGTAWAAHDLWRIYRVWRQIHDLYFVRRSCNVRGCVQPALAESPYCRWHHQPDHPNRETP